MNGFKMQKLIISKGYHLRMLGVLLSFFSILFCKNNIYAEFGGAGYTRTINYDRKLHNIYNLRIGYGFNNTDKNGTLHFYPMGASYLINKEDYDIEVGLGTTLLNGVLEMRGDVIGSDQKIIFICSGYRKYLIKGKLFVGLKIYYLKVKDESAPWAGLSIGWAL
tara:strand:+ start:134 stop:625 length:492 start_codon:yes stop_codon:yes gene_type:complete